MTRRPPAFIVCVLAALGAASAARADDPETVTRLDCVATPKLLETHFARFGYEPLKRIRRQEKWVRVQLPGAKGTCQTGLYSYVVLSGDFRIDAEYGFALAPTPTAGYGMSCGIAVKTNGPAGMVSLSRNYAQGKGGSGYAVTTGVPVEGKPGEWKYDTKIFPSADKKGRLVLRREGKELVCLAADGKAQPKELCRLDFTDATVREVHLYADPGGSPTPLDAWVGALKVTAEEIAGGFPRRERRREWPWVPIIIAAAVATGVFVAVRRRQAK